MRVINLEVNNKRIQDLTLEEVMGERFGRYSKAIIQDRALPDIRDGLKPVQRRILYAMNKDGNTYDKGFRKSAKSVGNVMGNYHPHGDSSIYEAMVRMSQNWKLREPLIEMHGNNGSIDADPPAAMRYTEARLSKISQTMLRDINKNTVKFVPNFDDTEEEPTVLPARMPNLLVNGASGISAGYATEIPPHNLGEIIDALIALLRNSELSIDDLLNYIKGPDFPTGGIVQGINELKKAYNSGTGKVVIRSKTNIKPLKAGKKLIEITEIPYEVNKALLIKKIDELRFNKKIEGIIEVRDESDRDGLKIAIEIKADADANDILNFLFKNTDLQINYNFNMVAIHNMRPERINLKTALQAYLDFQEELITKRTQYDLDKAQKRLHIVEGLIKALSILDQVIKTIRSSQNKTDAKQNLVKQYEFTEEQAEAIVILQLYRLTNTDVTALQEEHKNLEKQINEFKNILSNKQALHQVLQNELLEIKNQFATPRLTKIEAEVEKLNFSKEVTVAKEDVMVLVSHDGYVKRSSIRSFKASDIDDNGLKEEDYPILIQKANTLEHLLIFTNLGNLIYRPIHELADTKWKNIGEHLSQSINLLPNEFIVQAVITDNLNDINSSLIVITKYGLVKQINLNKCKFGRTYKTHAFVYEKFKESNDEVIRVLFKKTVNLDQQIVMFTKLGMGLRFLLNEVPANGLRTSGVQGMKLNDNDEVISANLINSDAYHLILLDSRGDLKRCKITEIPLTKRSRKGVLCMHKYQTIKQQLIDTLTVNSVEFNDNSEDTDEYVIKVITNHYVLHKIVINQLPLTERTSRAKNFINVQQSGLPICFIN